MPQLPGERVLEIVSGKVGAALVRSENAKDLPVLVLASAAAHDALATLLTDPELQFRYLVDLTAVDYLGYPKRTDGRFCVVYHLHSFRWESRLRAVCFLADQDPAIRSVADLWGNASWLEREVYDLYGIRFENHPDLRRILMPDDYPGHPLRKDYPLRGRGERSNFPKVIQE